MPRRRRCGRLLVRLGLLALTCMIVGAISSYSFLLSAAGLRTIRAWNRISVVIAFCALAAVALVVDQFADRLARRRPDRASVMAGVFGIVLLGAGLFDQTSSADRPAYSALHARYASDEAFFQAVADRLPPGTPVFEAPHLPFPEVGPRYGTAGYDQARGFVFQPQLAWSFGFMRGRHPEYPLAFEAQPPQEWLTSVAAIGFRGLVVDRFGYADNGALFEAGIEQVLGTSPLPSRNGRYSFFDLTSYADDTRARLGDTAMAAIARHALASGPLQRSDTLGPTRSPP